jgi:iron complex outermembrane recepter protein
MGIKKRAQQPQGADFGGGLKTKRTRSVGCVAAALIGQLWICCASAQTIAFDIPGGNGDKSLLEFARQSGIDVVGSSFQLHNVKTPAIRGTYDADVVLEMMLKGTGLKASRSAEGVVTISSAEQRNVCHDEGETMHNNSKLKTTASWLAMAVAMLQCAAAQDSDSGALETVVVTGLRGSLQQSLDVKRDSLGLVDAITMEDIGKFPDSNLATAMMRIPGITVTRASTVGFGMTSTGQATQITARGFGPAFNETLFDGRFIPSATGGRSFDFSVLSADLVQRLDVLKTPDASMSAGAIGATINVKYPKPFDKNDSVLVASSSASYSPENGNVTPNGSFLVSQTFDGTKIGKFGILVAGAFSDIKTTVKQASVWGWEGTYIDPCQYKNATTTCGSTLTTDTTTPVWFMQDYAADYSQNDEQRINGRVAAQWQPIDNLVLTADGNYSRYAYKASKWMYAIWNNVSQMRDITTSKNGTIVDFTRVNSTSDFDAEYVMQVQQTYDYGLNAKWSVNDKLSITADFDQALSSLNPGNQLSEKGVDIGYGGNANGADIRIVVPTSGHALPYYASYGPNSDKSSFDDVSILGSHTNLLNSGRNRYLTNQAKVEATWTEDNWKVTAGVNYVANHYRTDYWSNSTSGADNNVIAYLNYGPASGNSTGVALPASLFKGTISLSNFISGWSGSPVPSLIKFNPDDEYAYLESLGDPYAKNIDGFYYGAGLTNFHGKFYMTQSQTSPQKVNEDNLSPYISGSADFTVDGMPLTVNAGLRYETTRMKSTGKFQLLEKMEISQDKTAYLWTYADAITENTATHNYAYFLPNLDMKLQVRDDFVVRINASETLTRPGLSALSPSLSVGGRVGSLVGTGNNPYLKPYLSKNFDIAEEWYFAPNSYFSVDTFFKQVTNFIVSGTSVQTDNGVIDPYTGQVAEFYVTSSVNGPQANVYGVELAFQYIFGDTGFGFQTNGTLIGTDKPYKPSDITTSGFAITGLAHSFNTVAFYDKNGLEARLAANWRDTYLDHFGQMQNGSAFGTEPTFVEGSWSLDGSVGYDITDNLTAYFEINNILGAIYRTRGRFTDQPLDFVDYGRHMTFGVHYKM